MVLSTSNYINGILWKIFQLLSCKQENPSDSVVGVGRGGAVLGGGVGDGDGLVTLALRFTRGRDGASAATAALSAVRRVAAARLLQQISKMFIAI